MRKTLLIKKKGFSLIEVLVALAIFSFVLLGVLSMMGAHISSNFISKNHSKAIQLAEDGIETLKSVDYATELSAFNGKVDDFGSIPNFPAFRRVYSVVPFSDYSITQVSVLWRSKGNNSKPIVLRSIRSATD